MKRYLVSFFSLSLVLVLSSVSFSAENYVNFGQKVTTFSLNDGNTITAYVRASAMKTYSIETANVKYQGTYDSGGDRITGHVNMPDGFYTNNLIVVGYVDSSGNYHLEIGDNTGTTGNGGSFDSTFTGTSVGDFNYWLPYNTDAWHLQQDLSTRFFVHNVAYSITLYAYNKDYNLNTHTLVLNDLGVSGSSILGISNVSDVVSTYGFFDYGAYPYSWSYNNKIYLPYTRSTDFIYTGNNSNIYLPKNTNININFTVSYLTTSIDAPTISFGDFPLVGYSGSALGGWVADGQISSSNSSIVNGISNTNSSINSQTQQQQQQYDDFTNAGSSTEVDSISSDVSSKIGLFDAVDEIGTGFYYVWQGTSNAPQLVFPAFSLRVDGVQYHLWDTYTFNFDEKFEEWGLGSIKTVLNFITVFLVYSALLHYLQNLYDRIFGGK